MFKAFKKSVFLFAFLYTASMLAGEVSVKEIHYWGVSKSSSQIFIPSLWNLNKQVDFLVEVLFGDSLEGKLNILTQVKIHLKKNIDLLYAPYIEGLMTTTSEVWKLIYDSAEDLDSSFHKRIEKLLIEEKIPDIAFDVANTIYYRFKNSYDLAVLTSKEREKRLSKEFIEKNKDRLDLIKERILALYLKEVPKIKDRAAKGLLNEYLFPGELFSGEELLKKKYSSDELEKVIYLLKVLNAEFVDYPLWKKLCELAWKHKGYSLSVDAARLFHKKLLAVTIQNQKTYLDIFKVLKIKNTGLGPRLLENNWLAVDEWKRDLARFAADAERIFIQGGLFSSQEDESLELKEDLFSSSELSKIKNALTILYGPEFWDFLISEKFRPTITMSDFKVLSSGSIMGQTFNEKLSEERKRSRSKTFNDVDRQQAARLLKALEFACAKSQ